MAKAKVARRNVLMKSRRPSSGENLDAAADYLHWETKDFMWALPRKEVGTELYSDHISNNLVYFFELPHEFDSAGIGPQALTCDCCGQPLPYIDATAKARVLYRKARAQLSATHPFPGTKSDGAAEEYPENAQAPDMEGL